MGPKRENLFAKKGCSCLANPPQIAEENPVMQNLLVSLVILFSGLQALAFEYKIEESNLLRPSALQGHALTQIFAQKSFRSVSDASLIGTGLPFDKVFVSGNWEKALMLKAGLSVPANIEGRLIEEKSLGVTVFHFRFEGTPYLLLSLNNSRDELRNLVKPWLKSSTPVAWSLFFPQANAMFCMDQDNLKAGLQTTANFIEKNEILQGAGKCALDALHAAKSSANDTLDFFKKLVSDPKALWSEMKESFVQLREFAVNIQSELQQALAQFKNLPLENKVELACKFAGTAMVGAVQVALSGAALGRVLPALLLKLKASTLALKNLSGLELIGVKLPNQKLVMHEVMSCAF